MGSKITPTQWLHFKNAFPDQVASMTSVVMPANIYQLRSYWQTKKSKGNKITQAALTSSDPISDMLAWCSESLTGNFYVEKSRKTNVFLEGIVFYFFEEDDAVLFKLTWWQS